MTRESEKKVLMILESCFPTEGGGGAEGQVRTLSRYLHRHGVPVAIVAPMVAHGPQREHDHVDGVPVWRIPYPPIRKIGALVMLLKFVAFLVRERRSYSVVHAHIANNLAAVASVVGRVLGKRVVVKMTGSLELSQGILDSAVRSPVMAMKRAALKRAHFIQATSSEIQEKLLEHGFIPERVRVIPNAVDTDRFSAAAADRKTVGSPRTAVYVGRLESDKGTDILIKAWIDAFANDAGMRLLVVGEGRQRAMLEKLIRKHDRRDIQLFGAQANVLPFLVEADFAVLPSRYEGLSNALLEYMAAGLPVLATRVSGSSDYVEHDYCGWLVASEDGNALADQFRAVAALDMHALHRCGERARQRVIDRARIDSVVAQLATLYDIDSVPFSMDANASDELAQEPVSVRRART